MGQAGIKEDHKEEEEEEKELEEDKGEEQHLLKSNQQDPVRETEARKPNPSRVKHSYTYEPITDEPAVDLSGSYGRGQRHKKPLTGTGDSARFVQTDYDITDFISEDFAGHAQATQPKLEDLPPPSVPNTYGEAMASEHTYFWREAMDEEMVSMEGNGVFELTELPSGSKTVGGRWVYALKKGADGRITRFKARWVAKGFSQQEGVDYVETYAPVSKLNSLRIVLAIAASEDLDLVQGDFKTAFLTADLVETVFMEQPTGYEQKGADKKKLVAHLLKALYGLKQSPLAFYNHSSKFLQTQLNLHPLEADPCIYIGHRKGQRIMLVQYVDDFVAAGDKEDLEWVMTEIQKEFKIDDRGDLNPGTILGIDVTRDRKAGTMDLSQKRYVQTVLERFNMVDAKSNKVPMDDFRQLSVQSEDSGSEKLDGVPYLEAVGSLMYLQVCTRPDIAFAVGVLSRFSSDPRRVHWGAVKKVMRYLQGSADTSLQLGGHSDAPIAELWTDSDYAGDTESRRSTTGLVVKVFGSTVIWASRRQKAISLSSLEAEYIALSAGCRNLRWVAKILAQLGYDTGSIPVNVDNQGAIETTKNGTHSEKTKHIDVAYKYGREAQQSGFIKLNYCPTEDMQADILTKALGVEKLERFKKSLNIQKEPSRMDQKTSGDMDGNPQRGK
jgi:hypothetical protein